MTVKRRSTFFGLSGSSGSRAFDSDVVAWEAAVIANGGTVSLARRIIIDQFVFSEKASGTWALTDDYWLLWGENAAQALTSLKRRELCTAVNSPTFTADRSYLFDGATNYLLTGFTPSTDGINLTGSNLRLATYERVNLNNSSYSIGARVGTNPAMGMIPRASSSMTGVLNNITTSATFTLSPADSRGLKVVSRAGGGTTMLAYDRGVRLTDVTTLTAGGATLPTVPLMIGAYNSGGTPISHRAATIGFAAVGAPLSDAQELAQYSNVQAMATSIGANV
jgi:hypothetical protein